MKKYHFNKLIRSKLPKRMQEEGVKLEGRTLNKVEFIHELKNKLLEEAAEVKDCDSNEELIRELSDVMEVIEAIILATGITQDEIEAERLVKRKTNGHFLPENYVNYVEVPESNTRLIEYLEIKNRPYKYEA